MLKIGITGSLASGKTSAAELFSKNKHPIFSADRAVKNLYKKKSFLRRIQKIFKIKN